MSNSFDENRFDRRQFITLTALGLSGMSLTSACTTQKRESENALSEGEEWRTASKDTMTYLSEQVSPNEILSEAAGGIEKFRKSNVKLTVKDENNKPLRGLKINLVQQDSFFDWGLAFVGKIEERNDPVADKKMRHIRNLFNHTTAKCYWDERWHQPVEAGEGQRIYHVFRDEIFWGRANGMQVKGHPLVWTVRKAIPEWLDKYDHFKRLNILETHVRSLVRQGKGLVSSWDVVNEMLWEPTFRNYLQRNWPHIEPVDKIADYVATALEWVREEDPDAKLVINDYGLQETIHEEITAKQQRKRYINLAENLIKRGSAPDAIGTQAHVGGWYSPKVFKTSLDDLSKAGLPIQVTEFWAHFEDEPGIKNKSRQERLDALIRYITDCYTIAFGHPSVAHFTYWGGGKHFFTEDGQPTPVYRALYNLIKKRWRTEFPAKTDNNGSIMFRGFHGRYIGQFYDQHGNINKFNFSVYPGQDNIVVVTKDRGKIYPPPL